MASVADALPFQLRFSYARYLRTDLASGETAGKDGECERLLCAVHKLRSMVADQDIVLATLDTSASTMYMVIRPWCVTPSLPSVTRE